MNSHDYVEILENVQIYKSIENALHFREFRKSLIFDTFGRKEKRKNE